MIWALALAVIAGDVVGVLIFRHVQRLGHRLPDEARRSRPSVWWLAFLGPVWGLLVWRLASEPWPLLVLWLPLSAALAWLAAVDQDVSRLPDRLLTGTAAWTGVSILLRMWITGPSVGIEAVLAALLSAGGFAVIHFVGRGERGFGDIKLAAIIGAAAVTVSWPTAFYALVGACVLALAWGAARRDATFAFGPWLAVGAVLAVGLAR
jgi:leader peptidase (prepilin peptidase) / N-methyltransferase